MILTPNSAPSTRRKYRKKAMRDAETFRNLMVCLVFTCCLISYLLLRPASGTPTPLGNKKLRGGDDGKNYHFNMNSFLPSADMEHLIIVAGHSVILEGNLKNAGTDENLWFLYDYQKGKGLPQVIVSHIRAGISEASKDSKSLLVFSGGITRGAPGPIDEGGSYYRVADALNLWENHGDVRARTVTEEFATDSFQNLLFSVCRFKEVTSVYPKNITLISYSIKRARFEEMHAPALHISPDDFRFVGIDPPESTGFDYFEALNGEKMNAASLFENDPYGCYSVKLQEKRKSRNPFMRTPWYDLTCPDMKEIMHWCGPDYVPKEKTPWANLT